MLGLFFFHLLFIQNKAGAVVYASIFNSIPKIEIEILTELLVHVKSSQKESDFALSALEMATKNKLKAHIIYLKGLLESSIQENCWISFFKYIWNIYLKYIFNTWKDHSSSQIRRIYALVASITTANDSNLLILLRKQVGNYDEKVKKVGIIGTVQAIGILGKAGTDHMINDMSTMQNTMTQVNLKTASLSASPKNNL